jgi:ABC-type Mn2+/Zn2+ transport system ATPase subunit
MGVLYVLDEPSIGLHPRDTRRLLNTLEGLRDLGNTVLWWSTMTKPSAAPTGWWTLARRWRAWRQVIAEGTPEQIQQVPRA